jgi:RNAse (barnase) inhibitor barstar
MKIFINWNEIENFQEFFDCFLPQVKAPDWHGRNMDAFRDSIVAGNINEVEPPFCVINTNSEELSDSAREVFNSVADVYSEANLEGRKIRVFSE